ncbi:Z1 domain-containing protein [Chitinophaga sp. Cy-1792]|uniref:Z1 domain-containing protein n=1 Tax=Chitinophaga sp. Cy-1792 TaxID=2608339 RepID=UPI00141F3A87|nr:Z1 domain-containing protein [Chitinophaga sp. Cy-1792]NIG54670.1 endonuclease [Chitinophaga sp. Cy-1792]
MSNNYGKAKSICLNLLSDEIEAVNAESIRNTLDRVGPLFNLENVDREKLQKELESMYAVFSNQYKALDDSSRPEPWVKNARAAFQWRFWNRYRRLLEKKNYAPDTINKLDNLTDDILDRLPAPGTAERYDKRGLIVGQVQSGKTGNYIGLICKAADVGYKIIIVLAGVHNSLRSQTQLRIDEGFLGFDTQLARSLNLTNNRIGVGKFPPEVVAHSLTTNAIDGDFSRQASEKAGVNIRGNDPIIITVKKNATVLKNLLSWLYGRGETMSDNLKLIRNVPLLIIDDEADNASINISKSKVSGINGCIRALIKLFEQSVYIGYTATPFANIFIKPGGARDDEKGLLNVNNLSFSMGDDIFPKNFIINIPAPSNYVGPEKIFSINIGNGLTTEKEFVRLYEIVTDYLPYIKEGHKPFNPEKKQADTRMEDIPPTLKKAIKYFFLVCAARRARGQFKEHNSMLIHMSRFVSWQDRIANIVLEVVKDYAGKVELNDPYFLRELEICWRDEFMPKTKQVIEERLVNDANITVIEWLDLLPHLHPAVSKIEVRAIHGDKRIEGLEHKNIRPLDYYDNRESGMSVIAIGGNKLSRGLTLEGLTISYFLRASKMYDTLMQMGRWFGYRPGYLDLCRLFTSSEMIQWYRHITVATEEMRAEFDHMSDLGRSPQDYGLKVRTHPGALVITAANKFGYRKIMTLSFSGRLIETYKFKKGDRQRQLQNYNRTIQLINDLGVPGKLRNSDPAFRNHFVWSQENNVDLVIDFLNAYTTDQPSFNKVLITRYITAQVEKNHLCNWTIVLINNTKDASLVPINNLVKIGLTSRADVGDDTDYVITQSRLIDPRHEYIDLTDEEIRRAQKIAEDSGNGRLTEIPSPPLIRAVRRPSNALLLIYLLDNKPDKDKASVADVPLAGLAISFPQIIKDVPIEYAVNEQFLKELDYPEELDERDVEDDGIISDDKQYTTKESLDSFLENKGGVNKLLGQDEFFKRGVKVRFSASPRMTGQPTAIPMNVKPDDSIPYFRAEDISRYYVNRSPDFWIADPDTAVIEEDMVIAPRIYSGQAFGLCSGKYMIDDDCIQIGIADIPAPYLCALLNSVFFAYYVISLNPETNAETGELVRQFPIDRSGSDNVGIMSLVWGIQMLNSTYNTRESSKLSSYFINVLDAAIFEIYFPEEFKESNLSVLSELTMLPPFDNSLKQLQEFYETMNRPDSAIKKAVYAVTTIDKINYIYRNL